MRLVFETPSRSLWRHCHILHFPQGNVCSLNKHCNTTFDLNQLFARKLPVWQVFVSFVNKNCVSLNDLLYPNLFSQKKDKTCGHGAKGSAVGCNYCPGPWYLFWHRGPHITLGHLKSIDDTIHEHKSRKQFSILRVKSIHFNIRETPDYRSYVWYCKWICMAFVILVTEAS